MTLSHDPIGDFSARPPRITIDNFDLETVEARLREKHPGWDDQRVDKALLEYRRFLALCKAYPSRKISPSLDVDEVWHLHILDTRKYPSDCEKLFGYFLHHEACIGERDQALRNMVAGAFRGSCNQLF